MQTDLDGISERTVHDQFVGMAGMLLSSCGVVVACLWGLTGWLPLAVAAATMIPGGLVFVWLDRRPATTDLRIDAAGVHIADVAAFRRSVEHFAPDQVAMDTYRFEDGRRCLRVHVPGGRVFALGVGATEAELQVALEAVERLWASSDRAGEIPEDLDQLLAATTQRRRVPTAE